MEIRSYATKSGYPTSSQVPSRKLRPTLAREPVPPTSASTSTPSRSRRGTISDNLPESRPSAALKVPDSHYRKEAEPIDRDEPRHRFAPRATDARLEAPQREPRPIKREYFAPNEAPEDTAQDDHGDEYSAQENDDEVLDRSSFADSDDDVLQKP